MSYNVLNAPAVRTATASGTAGLAVSTPNEGRVGYSIFNKGDADVYVAEYPAGAGAPTAAVVIAAPSYVLPAGVSRTRSARAKTAVYVAGAIEGTVTFQEIG